MPARASRISAWPLPATPATPTISPRRTSKVTPFTRGWPRASSTTSPSTARSVSPGRAAAFSTWRLTARPTISSASSSGLVSTVGRVATTWPWRMTVTASVTSRISRSL